VLGVILPLMISSSSLQILSACSYAATSVCILIFNKQVLSDYGFNYPVLMTLFHMLVSLFLLTLFRSIGLLSFASFNLKLARSVLPLALCFVLNIMLGMCALRLTNIPMFATLRRLTGFICICTEYLLLNKKPTAMTATSVFIMILGSFIGGWGDLQFDLLGYSYVLLNNLVTALYLTFIKRILNDTQLKSDTFGIMYYNSIISIPFLLLLAMINGELSTIAFFPHLFNSGFQLSFLLSAMMAFGVNYTTFWCTEVNSPLTTSVTGQVKNVLSSFISLFTPLSHVKATPLLITGLAVGLLGSFLYALALAKQTNKNKSNNNNNPNSTEVVKLLSNEHDDQQHLRSPLRSSGLASDLSVVYRDTNSSAVYPLDNNFSAKKSPANSDQMISIKCN
jgi:solute carrier family 35 protein